MLSRAFYDDPPFMWMLPDARSRERRAQGTFKTILRSHALKYGGVEVKLTAEPLSAGRSGYRRATGCRPAGSRCAPCRGTPAHWGAGSVR